MGRKLVRGKNTGVKTSGVVVEGWVCWGCGKWGGVEVGKKRKNRGKRGGRGGGGGGDENLKYGGEATGTQT